MELNYLTYKFYDQKGRRLAIMGNVQDSGRIDIIVITCSKKDDFNKSVVRQALLNISNIGKAEIEEQEVHPQFFTINTTERPKFTFIKWCQENYGRRITTYGPALKTYLVYKDDWKLLSWKLYPKLQTTKIVLN